MKHQIFKYCAAIALVTSSITMPVVAQQNVKGLGWYSCDEFQEIYENASMEKQSQLVISLFSWFQGYASGKNQERLEESQRDLQDLLPDMIFQQTGAYCSSNNSSRLFEAAENIYERLPAIIESTV